MFSADAEGPEEVALDTFRFRTERQIQRALLRTAAITADRGKTRIRERFAGAGLGRLGQAIAGEHDTVIHARSDGGFSASAQFFVRSRSDRTRGAIESYTEGSDIRPVRGRWLWIPTEDAQRVAGSGAKKRRLTPGLWRENGLDRKIGPLIMIRSANGRPILAVENIGVDLSGARPSAKSLKKNGMPRVRQIKRQLVVMFVAIPRTSRAARVNITEILRGVRDEFAGTFNSELMGEVI